MLNMIITVLAMLGVVLLWILLYDSNRFVVRHHQLKDERIIKPFRAILLADLHNKEFGPGNEQLLAAIKEAQPDILLIAGDVLTAKPGLKQEKAIRFLEGLCRLSCPIFYANGNHEQRMKLYPEKYGEMDREYEESLANLGIVRMVNQKQQLPQYGVTVYGVEIEREYFRRFHITPMEEGYLEHLLGKADPEVYNILIAHNPDYFPWYAGWGADLTVSGHVHGGMVRIPGWKGVVSPMVRFFPKYDGGLFEEKGKKMLLSRGLGMHTIPVRMFNPAEVLVIDFEPQETSDK